MAQLTDLYKFKETTGTIDPADYAVVEKIVKDDIREVFGVDEDAIHESTPLGRMIEWMATHFTNVLGLNVQNANQLIVSAAAGQQLDALGQWFQLERKGSSYSTVTVRCFGSAGTVIPAGTTVRNTNGNTFESLSDATIASHDDDAYVDIVFEALEEGLIPVDAGEVNIIDTPVAGWESCVNQGNGVVGSAIETDESFRRRIQDARTVAPGFLEAIKNAVDAEIGSSGSVMAIENNTGNNLDVHGVNMEPHSILVCVDGLVQPDAQGSYKTNEMVIAVAKAIFNTKPCGTGYTTFSSGQYEVPVTDVYGNSYNVYFCAPIAAPITIDVTVKNRSYTGTNLESDIRSAILNWVNTRNYQCGEDVFASDIIKAIESAIDGIIVVECKASDGGTGKGTSYVEIDAVHKASFAEKDILVQSFVR